MHYYNKKLPKVNDIVFVSIKNMSISGTYCNLIEYDFMEGFILNTELDRNRRDDKRQIRIHEQRKFKFGEIYPALVLSVHTSIDDVTGNTIPTGVDLSYKKVNIESREELLQKFNYVTKIKQLCDEFMFHSKLNEKVVYSLTMWIFMENNNDFKKIFYDFLKDPNLFVTNLSELYPDITQSFVENMKKRITYTKLSIEQPFVLTIYDTNGVNKLIEILTFDKNLDCSVECISSPNYRLIASSYTENECNEIIMSLYNEIQQRSSKYRSSINLKERKNTGIIKEQEIYIKPLNMITF